MNMAAECASTFFLANANGWVMWFTTEIPRFWIQWGIESSPEFIETGEWEIDAKAKQYLLRYRGSGCDCCCCCCRCWIRYFMQSILHIDPKRSAHELHAHDEEIQALFKAQCKHMDPVQCKMLHLKLKLLDSPEQRIAAIKLHLEPDEIDQALSEVRVRATRACV
jgi:hypothetical protein